MGIDFKKLSAPFTDDQLEWRVQSSGLKNGTPWALIIPYVDARAIMDRLDEVVGPDRWRDEYEHIKGQVYDSEAKVIYETILGVKCTLRLLVDDFWVEKQDGSAETAIEAFKGGISKSFVRAAVKWGMGRDLYNTPPTFAQFIDKKTATSKQAKIERKYFNWIPPLLNNPKPEPTPEATRAKSGGFTGPLGNKIAKSPHSCSLCGSGLVLRKDNSGYYCINYRDNTKGVHTSIKNLAV